MRCPTCGSNSDEVLDTRNIEGSSVVKRRRLCHQCKKRFTTYERVEFPHLMVVKSDDTREVFDREKLVKGIRLACLKRPTSEEVLEQIVGEIERELHDYIMEVPSKIIGELVLKRLKRIDEVAYVRFASIYRKFDSVEAFLKELKNLRKKKFNKS